MGFIVVSAGFTVNPYIPAFFFLGSFKVFFNKCLTLFSYIFKVTSVIVSMDSSVFLNSHSNWLFLEVGVEQLMSELPYEIA